MVFALQKKQYRGTHTYIIIQFIHFSIYLYTNFQYIYTMIFKLFILISASSILIVLIHVYSHQSYIPFHTIYTLKSYYSYPAHTYAYLLYLRLYSSYAFSLQIFVSYHSYTYFNIPNNLILILFIHSFSYCSHTHFHTVHKGHPWYSGNALDYWHTGRAIDPAPGA